MLKVLKSVNFEKGIIKNSSAEIKKKLNFRNIILNWKNKKSNELNIQKLQEMKDDKNGN